MSEFIASVINLDRKDGSTVGRVTRLNDPLEEIVRCRECKFFHIWREPQGQICLRLKFADGRDMSNGFCAWGERA